MVVRGLDDGIYYNIIQLSPLSAWSGWRQVPDGATPSAPSVAAYDEDSLYLDVFVRQDNGIQSNASTC